MASSSKEAMDQLLSRPHVFFWLSIPVVLMIGFFGKDQFSIIIQDTYYVASSRLLAVYISFGFALLGLIYHNYLRSGYRLNKWLTLIHMFCSLDMSILLWLSHVWHTYSNEGKNSSIDFNMLFIILIGIIGFGQLIFFLHVLILRFQKNDPSLE